MGFKKGHKKTPEHCAKLAEMCRARNKSPEHRALMSARFKGKPLTAKHRANIWANRSHIFTPEACLNMGLARIGKKQSHERRLASAASKIGPKNPNWRGGKTDDNKLKRDRSETKIWREKVFARDGHACGICFSSKGGTLQAHHIKPLFTHPELRWDVDNGMTLCKKCHSRITATHALIGLFKRKAA